MPQPRSALGVTDFSVWPILNSFFISFLLSPASLKMETGDVEQPRGIIVGCNGGKGRQSIIDQFTIFRAHVIHMYNMKLMTRAGPVPPNML